MYQNIPDELKQLNNWCVWNFVEREGRLTKEPLNANDPRSYAKSNDSSTWSSFGAALRVVENGLADGIGFFFTTPYIGIDLDGMDDDLHRFINGDHSDNKIAEFYETLKSYGEISPSGKGIHIITKGEIPGSRRRKGNVEMYSSGRFFTMTGDSLGKYKTVDAVDKKSFEYIYQKYLDDSNKVLHLSPNREHGLVGHDLSEAEVIQRALGSAQGPAFNDLLKGEWREHYSSQSEADLAFANMLAFWCARDFGQMDSIFRQSGMYREKWDEKRGETTYGASTLQKAINETADVFKPSRREEPLQYVFGEEFGGSKQTKKEYPVHSYDDTGNAQRFEDRFGEFVRYVYAHKKFYVYDGAKWAMDDMGNVRTLIDELVDELKDEPIVTSEDVDEEEALKNFRKHLKYSRGNTAKKRIQDEMQHRLAIRAEEFDKDDTLFNAINGYLDLTDGSLHDHDMNKMFSLQADTEFTPNASPDTWLRFLDDIFAGDREMIRFIQKCVGYTLSGSIREQVMFILHGIGRNGKSLFVDTISDILGSYAKNIRAESLMIKSAGQSSVGNDIARLQGARMVTSSEPNEGFRFDEGLIKQLTGEEKVTARFLYGEDFEFKPKFKIWLTTNHKPIVRGTDDGIWRRLILIPFEVQIPEDKVDKNLKHKLMREAPAILNWALEGSLMWQREGLNPPQKVLDASVAYRNEMDVIEFFISEECIVGEGYEIGAQELFKAYKNWAKESGEYSMGQRKFGMKMKEKYERKRKENGNFYLGLNLKKNNDPRLSFIK